MGKLDVLIEPLSNYYPSPEPTIVPIAVFSSGDQDSQSNAVPIAADVQASFDYVLFAPPSFDRTCSDAITADLNELYRDTNFTDEIERLGLVPHYLAGVEYVEGLQEVGSKFCKRCSCSKSSCKKKCKKCK